MSSLPTASGLQHVEGEPQSRLQCKQCDDEGLEKAQREVYEAYQRQRQLEEEAERRKIQQRAHAPKHDEAGREQNMQKSEVGDMGMAQEQQEAPRTDEDRAKLLDRHCMEGQQRSQEDRAADFDYSELASPDCHEAHREEARVAAPPQRRRPQGEAGEGPQPDLRGHADR